MNFFGNFFRKSFVSLLVFPCFLSTSVPFLATKDFDFSFSQGSITRFCVLKVPNNFYYSDEQGDWGITISGTRWSGETVSSSPVQILPSSISAGIESYFFYFVLPSDTQAIRFSTHWKNNPAFDTSLVFPVLSDEVFHLSVSSSLQIEKNDTNWETIKFSAAQLADLVIQNIDPFVFSGPLGYCVFPSVEKGIVNNMDNSEKDNELWSGIRWIDKFENKDTSLYDKYNVIKEKYLAVDPQYYTEKPSLDIFSIFVSVFCFLFVLILIIFGKGKKNGN